MAGYTLYKKDVSGKGEGRVSLQVREKWECKEPCLGMGKELFFGQPKYFHLAVSRQIVRVRKCSKRSIFRGSVAGFFFPLPSIEGSCGCSDSSVINRKFLHLTAVSLPTKR